MKILLVAPNQSSFIKKDYENLRSGYETNFMTCWSPSQIFDTLKQVFHHDICFFWFASIRFLPVFLLAKILKKKTIVIAGGYDVSNAPEIDYGGIRSGSFCSFLRKGFLQFADKVITVSDSNTNEALRNTKIRENQLKRIYLGFDRPNIALKPWNERKNQIVFIACCDTTSYKIKGFETFLELARKLPEYTFIHIGQIHVQKFQKDCYGISNIRTLGYVENMSEVFSEVLNDSKIILLPSKIESFGASILEGGLHGCVPVASNCYALPEIIGEMGSICELEDFSSYINAIHEIMTRQADPISIQDYYYEKFNTNKRRENLFHVLKSVI